MTDIKSLQNHFSAWDLQIIAEALEQYSRQTGHGKQASFRIRNLVQIFREAGRGNDKKQ